MILPLLSLKPEVPQELESTRKAQSINPNTVKHKPEKHGVLGWGCVRNELETPLNITLQNAPTRKNTLVANQTKGGYPSHVQ